MLEQVVTYREYPQQVLMVNGKPYMPLKTGLKADDPIFEGIADPIIERPPTGRQRKPRRYISVDGWAKLLAYAFKVYLQERAPEEEIRTPWPWYGVKRAEDMLAIEGIQSTLVNEGYLRIPAKGEPTIVKYDYILTEKGRATEWLRYRMQAPSPFGEWKATVVIDISHIGFAEFIEPEPRYTKSLHRFMLEAIQEAHDKRERIWRKRHPWIVRMREYEAAAEAVA